MTKYGLVGIPVVDADGKLLGIVTVDDALDVIEDEHERDLEMTSGTRSETVGAPGAGHLSWFLRRELWFGVWVFVTAIIQHVAPGELPVLAAGLPAHRAARRRRHPALRRGRNHRRRRGEAVPGRLDRA